MAYVALTSLKTTIELQFLHHLHDHRTPLKSFYENLYSLQAFLVKKSSRGAATIKYFKTIIRDFALKVEDDIEIQLSNFLLAKDAATASQQLCQILQQAQEKTAKVVEIINEEENEYYRENDDLTSHMRIIDHHMKSMVFYDQTLFKSLNENLSSLQQLFLHTPKFRDAAIKDFETKIRDLVIDEMKIGLSSFVLAKDTVDEEEASQELCQTLQRAQEKTVELEERLKTYECCDDLTSLMSRIHHYLMPLRSDTRVYYVQRSLKSLNKNLFALQEFLQKSNNFGAAEIHIRDIVLKAKEVIDKQLTNFCVANKKHPEDEASEALFQTLYQATENAAQLLSTIHNTTISNQADDTLQSEFKFSRCYPKLEGRMIGREDDVSMIKNRLFSRFHGVKVIPIIGMPGIGKTTLARKILEDQSVALHFQVRGWVTVTKNYSEREMLFYLLSSCTPSDEEIIERTPLQSYEVGECLEDKRYLIVLDDIWSTHHWDELEDLFPNCENGSCILLTTRFYGVADYACTIKGTFHVMSLLDPNQSWDLFSTIFPLQKYRAPSYEKFRNHLSHVVEICEGLPLAIVLVAERLLECDNNIQHELKKIEKEIELLGILDYNALILMYNQLPECLKSCFLYLGVFPKHSEIQVKTLLRLWIAEGFVKPSFNNN